jgi:hypothetical protein
MTEHPGSLLDQLLRERFPSHAEARAEAHRPVPVSTYVGERPYTRGGSGLTRLEVLLLAAKRNAA